MRRATVLRRRSFLEGLESRQVLSGVVGATLSGDTLTITGDDASNQIAIYSDEAGNVVVAGGTDDDGETEITGDAQPFTGVTNIILDLAGGDDTAVITNLELGGELTADLGDGDDQLIIQGTVEGDDDESLIDLNGDEELVLGEVNIAGDVVVNAEDGSDLLSITDATIGGSLEADMGAGDDSVAVLSSDITGDVTVDDTEAFRKSKVTLSEATVGGDVTLTLSDKADQVWLRDVTVGTETEGGTEGGIVSIDTAAGNDKVAVRDLTAAELSVLSGDGVDRVTLRGSDIAGDATIDLGTDYGAVTVVDSTAETLDITSTSTSRGVKARLSNVEAVDAVLSLGDGNDQVDISGSDFETLAVNLAGGRDRLKLRGNNVTTTTTLDGGDGQDRLQKLKRNALAGLTDTNFERANGNKGHGGANGGGHGHG